MEVGLQLVKRCHVRSFLKGAEMRSPKYYGHGKGTPAPSVPGWKSIQEVRHMLTAAVWG